MVIFIFYVALVDYKEREMIRQVILSHHCAVTNDDVWWMRGFFLG